MATRSPRCTPCAQQCLGEAVSHGVQLGIGQPLVAKHQRNLIRQALGAVLQEILHKDWIGSGILLIANKQNYAGDLLLRPDIRTQLLDRVEVIGSDIHVIHREAEILLNEGHQLQHADRVDDALLQEGGLVAVLEAVIAEEQVLGDEIFDLGFDCHHGFSNK